MFVTHSIPEAVFLVVAGRRDERAARADHRRHRHRPAAPARRRRRARSARYFELVTAVREALRRGGDAEPGQPVVEDAAAAASADRTMAEGADRVSVAAAGSARRARRARRGRRAGHGASATTRRPSLVFVAAIVALGGRRPLAAPSGRFILPAPSAIVAALGENWSRRSLAAAPSAPATLFEAVGGLVIGTVAGVLVAFATARWATARDVLLPLAIAASAVPIIAFAPLMNNWFGVAQPAVEDDDGGGAGLLPGHGQRDPRPDPGRAGGARADALVRRVARGRSCARSCASRTRCRTSSRR